MALAPGTWTVVVPTSQKRDVGHPGFDGRFQSEPRDFGDAVAAGAYRASFKRYTVESLPVSVVFYALAAMLFCGAFAIRYRIVLILGFPLVALM
jgi:hypothetical protein